MKSIGSQTTNKQKQRSDGVASGFADSFMCTVWPLFLLTDTHGSYPRPSINPLRLAQVHSGPTIRGVF